jgi:hypothetical protein
MHHKVIKQAYRHYATPLQHNDQIQYHVYNYCKVIISLFYKQSKCKMWVQQITHLINCDKRKLMSLVNLCAGSLTNTLLAQQIQQMTEIQFLTQVNFFFSSRSTTTTFHNQWVLGDSFSLQFKVAS